MTSMKRRLALIMTLSLLGALACDEGALPQLDGPTSPIEDSAFVLPPSQAQASNPEGHWPRELRSVAMDIDDRLVMRNSADEINERLGKLTLNLPLLSRVTNQDCVALNRAEMIEPRATLERQLEQIRAEGVTIDELVVNVELLTPKRAGIYHTCLGGVGPIYYNPEHRAHVLSALQDLAELDGLSAVTIGVELNAYYHLNNISTGQSARWDYPNLVSLYHEAYTLMKELNPELMIGPGLSWTKLMNQTTPEVAEELSLDLEDRNQRELALELALKRSVWSLLVNDEGELMADFVGVSLVSKQGEVPFEGNAEREQGDITAYFAQVGLMGAPLHPIDRSPLPSLPLAFSQLDWSSPNNANASGKGPYLERLKVALAHISPLFVSWLRLSDLPTQPASTSVCGGYTSEPKSYPETFCYAGLFDSSGVAREAWELFTSNP